MEIIETTPKIERLRIKNFAGISDAEMEFKRLNILIGPQASGKSVCAKLLFFFRGIVGKLPETILLEDDTQQIKGNYEATFRKYFPYSAWRDGPFEIEYVYGDFWVRVRRAEMDDVFLEIEYAPYFDSLVEFAHNVFDDNESPDGSILVENASREIKRKVAGDISLLLANTNSYIPAGRSFFSVIQNNIFSLLAANIDIDPFLTDFGRIYESARRDSQSPKSKYHAYEERISHVIRGKYFQFRNKDYIEAQDGRRILVANSSSGQQEALPLLMVIATDGGSPGLNQTFFVEEPEAHLFPEAQREVVHLLSSRADLASDSNSNQYFITTHSPYILTSVNNLMYAGKLMRDFPLQREKVIQAIGGADVIDPSQVAAYLMSDGTARSIIDDQSSLIHAEAIDEVSGELAQEFDRLVDIEYAEMEA